MERRSKRKTLAIGNAPRRAVLYARYSSQMQSDGWSIDAQLGDLRRHCDRMNWEIVGEYLDEAISAKTDQRPQFLAAMEAVRAGRANTIVVHKLDRFSRNMEDIFRYTNELENLDAGLVCTQQGIDTTNPISGKIVLAVLAALAESYLDNLSEETSKGKRARLEAGLPNGDVPYGYRTMGKSGEGNHTPPTVVPNEAEAIRCAFQLYATGQYSDARVAQALNDAGYRMRSKRHPDGHPFTKDTLTVMLDNPFYAGWVTYTADGSGRRSEEATRIHGLHDPIITQELYDRAVAVRAEKRGTGRRGSPLRQAHVYVAASLARCTSCRERLRAQGQAPHQPSYRDPSRERGIECAAKKRSIPAPVVDQGMDDYMSDLQLPPNWLDVAISYIDGGRDELDLSTKRRESVMRKLERLKRLVIDGDIEQNEYRIEKARLETDIAGIGPAPATVDTTKAATLLWDLHALWREASPEERRQIASQLFDAVYCDLDAKKVIAIQMKKAFLPLRNALFNLSECGSDGIRTRGLLRDRQAC